MGQRPGGEDGGFMNNDALVRYPSKQTELLWKDVVRHVRHCL
jgi:hypothetical protein